MTYARPGRTFECSTFSFAKSNFGNPSFCTEPTRNSNLPAFSFLLLLLLLLLLPLTPLPSPFRLPRGGGRMVLSTQVTFLNSSFFWLNKIIIFLGVRRGAARGGPRRRRRAPPFSRPGPVERWSGWPRPPVCLPPHFVTRPKQTPPPPLHPRTGAMLSPTSRSQSS